MRGFKKLQRPLDFSVIDFLRSEAYLNVLKTSNMPPGMLTKSRELISNNDSALGARAETLIIAAEKSLRNFYGDEGDIVIPFSGGYDSTGISALTGEIFGLDGRKIYLVTAVTGLTKKREENPARQAQIIGERLGMEVDHRFLDLSSFFGSLVIRSALEDSKKLGHPSLCSACKIVMEVGMAEAARELGATHIPWGYNAFQGALQWPEHHQAQRQAMQEYFRENYPDLNIGSPLFDIVELPIDPILLFGILGFSAQNSGGEARCLAAGLNPTQIDDEALYRFVKGKAESLSDIKGDLYDKRPQTVSFSMEVDSLRRDSSFMRGAYDETEHIQYRDEAF